MIIISDLRGQLCNRIFMTAYGVSLHALTGQTFLDFTLDKYAYLFPRTRRPRWAEIPYKLARYAVRVVAKAAWASRIGRFLIVDVTWENTPEISPMNPAFIARLKRRPLTFIRIIDYFDPSKLVLPDIPDIRQRFEPDPEVSATVREAVRRAKGEADVLVGVHVRLGDYDILRGGRYLYSLDVFQSAIGRMVELFPGRRVAIMACSDQKLTDEFLARHGAVRGPGTVLGDLYALAECDYILGPPSTFSLWAAYYGRKPIHQMSRPQPPESLGQFMVPDGHFECYDLNTV
jgi:hypothetical protein